MNREVDRIDYLPPPKADAGRRFTTWAGLILLLGIVVVGVSWSLLFWDEMTSGLKVLVVGASTMAALFFVGLLIIIRSGEQADRRTARRDAVYANAFFESVRPQLITRGPDHQPVHANRAYREVARKLDVAMVADTPPPVDRLFQTNQPEGSAAIFRLHNMNPETQKAAEELNLILPDGTLSRFRITVTRLAENGSELLWQVDEIADADDMTAILARAPVGLFSATQDGRVLSINERLERWLGGPDALSPAHINEFLEEPDILLGGEASHGKTVRSDTRIITRKGVVTPAVLIARWNATDRGELVASVALHGHAAKPVPSRTTPVTDEPSVSAAALLSSTAAPIPFGVLRIDGTSFADAKVTDANAVFKTMSGLNDVMGLPFLDLFDGAAGVPLAGKSFADVVQGDAIDVTLAGENPLPVALYFVSNAQQPTQLAVYLIDVSARRSLENQLRQSQKLQAIGQLAAGVAHDFNNLLTAIRLNTDELLQRHPVGDPSYPELQSINATGARAAALVKKLLAFSRQQTRRAERLDVSEALSDMYLTLKQTLGGQAQLTLSHARDLPPVMADKSQFDNVIMNLCVNARDAMEAQGGGTIAITSERLDRSTIEDATLLKALESFPTDDLVLISVADTGTGMTDAVKAKIFEPFFTTKDQGKGTGLGLATVYGVIQQSGGHLSVESVLGEGTTFNIYLPAAPELDAEETAAAASAPAKVERKPADLAGQGHILFVEDEASVRVIAAKSLRKRGYTVVEAEDGEEALEILEDTETPFDMLLSDVVMPGLDGPGLLRAGRSYLGDARIVFISGYAAEKFSDLLAEEPDVTFLPKPFTLAELAEKVKTEIGEASVS